MADKNFIVKNGLEVGGQEVVSSSGVVTSAALGGQTLASTDSPTFNNLTLTNDIAVGGDLNLTGDLNITGDVNSLSVTDLDVTDQTITLGAGQVESASGGSGIVVDGSGASILWDETNTEWDLNNNLHVTTIAATTAKITAEETSGATTSIQAGGSVGYIGTYSNHPLRVVANSGTKIHVATDGKIGIGSNHTNPLQTVDISGSAAGLNLQGGNNRIYFSNYRALEGATDASLLQVGEGFTDISLQGNVGIGAVSPDSILHITGNSDNGDGACQLIINDEDSDEGSRVPSIQFKGNGTNTTRMRGSPSGFYLSSSSSMNDDFIVKSDGNVGIGTSSPDRQLELEGQGVLRLNATGSNTDPGIDFNTSSANDMQIRYRGGTDKLAIYSYGTSSDVLTIQKSDGKVGIGTASPTKSLSVKAPSGSNGGIDVFHNNGNKAAELVHHGSGDEGRLSLFDGGTSTVQLHGETGQNSYINSGNVGIAQNTPQYPIHYGESTVIPNGRNLNWDGGEIYPAHQYLAVSQTSNASGNRPTAIGLQLYNESNTANTFAPAISWSHQSTSTNFSQSSAAIAGRRTNAISGDTNWHGGELHLYTARESSPIGLRDTASFIINKDAQAHLGGGESDTRIYIGSQGGEFGGNSSNWIRGSGSSLMYNSALGGTSTGNAHIWETTGAQRMFLSGLGKLTVKTANVVDEYTASFETSSNGDPGIQITRPGTAGFGIAVRGATNDYVDFQVNNGGATSFGEAGKLRLYHNTQVAMPGNHSYNVNDGWYYWGDTGRVFQTFNYNSAGAEVFLQNNRTASGQVAAFQYRIQNSPQSGGTIYADTSGYTGGNFSDYRLKNNVTDLTGSLDKIVQLRPISYNHVDTPDKTELGFIAHEINDVFPEFVHGEKDAVWTQEDIDNYVGQLPDVEVGDIKAQQVDYFSKEWTTHILHAIKELKAENDSLKARIETLEG